MSTADASALFNLRLAWEDRYKIDFKSADGVWSACRLGGGVSVLTADTPEQLRELIGQDYQHWQAEARRQQS